MIARLKVIEHMAKAWFCAEDGIGDDWDSGRLLPELYASYRASAAAALDSVPISLLAEYVLASRELSP